MCGRYTLKAGRETIAEHFDIPEVPEFLEPRYNIAPSQPVPVVRLDEGGGRGLALLRWGLIPRWSSEPKVSFSNINARAETVAKSPAFRSAYRSRRCLMPADGFYEWRVVAPGQRQPFFFRAADGGPLTFAALYDVWRNPDEPDADPLWSCTILTTCANDDVAFLHDRMPVLLTPERWEAWLAPDTDPEALLTAPPGGTLVSHPVSDAVSNVRNNGPQLIDPVPYDEPLALF